MSQLEECRSRKMEVAGVDRRVEGGAGGRWRRAGSWSKASQVTLRCMEPGAGVTKNRHPEESVSGGFLLNSLVGVAGFEPTTSASRRQRSTKLSYTPFLALRAALSAARGRLSWSRRMGIIRKTPGLASPWAGWGDAQFWRSTASRARSAMLSRKRLGGSESSCSRALADISSARARV
jgi:hypothetical protein